MVKKAVIPAAGLGTRLLPATKAQPKEMLPVLNKPVIQHVVEEAVEAGITDILIIIGRGKNSIQKHFDKSYELEEELKHSGKTQTLNQVENISDLAEIHYVRQKERKGLGDAVLYAEQHVGNQPFALLLGDTVFKNGNKPCTQKLINRYNEHGNNVASVQEVNNNEVHKYGIIETTQTDTDTTEIKELVEKPSKSESPSNLALSGRYVFNPEIFEALKNTEPGVNNELQLTDAMRKLNTITPCLYEGDVYDIGTLDSWIKTNTELYRSGY